MSRSEEVQHGGKDAACRLQRFGKRPLLLIENRVVVVALEPVNMTVLGCEHDSARRSTQRVRHKRTGTTIASVRTAHRRARASPVKGFKYLSNRIPSRPILSMCGVLMCSSLYTLTAFTAWSSDMMNRMFGL
eukprot:3295214-Rhodomonas_salina.6